MRLVVTRLINLQPFRAAFNFFVAFVALLCSFVAGRIANAFGQHPELECLSHMNGLGYRHAAINDPQLLTVIRFIDNPEL